MGTAAWRRGGPPAGPPPPPPAPAPRDAAAAGLDGDWRVTAWTAARAIGGDFPGPEDGGTANPVCADDARARYSPMEVSIRGGAVRVNGADCEATVSGAAVTARCNCGGAFIVCGSALTMRLEGATLRGTQRLDFNRMAGPAYCAVEATFEASRR